MTAHLPPVSPFDLVIFGGTGDLALRKLLPALLRRFADGQIDHDSRIYAVARQTETDASYRALVGAALARGVDDATMQASIAPFLQLLAYRGVDATADAGWPELASELLARGETRVRVFYLSTSPKLFVDLCQRLRDTGLNGDSARVVLEKPLGHDLASATAINDAVASAFAENQIFRIDHYLGKETVQNLLALRFANALFEPLWNAGNIDHVQITVAETVGLEQRASYYDGAGALRDMVQNHLLQLLCMVAMEPPTVLHGDAVRDEKLKVLRALRPITDHNAATLTVRGQYRAGATNGEAVNGYVEELDGLLPGIGASRTETFVALKAEIDNWRWAGVPFYLRTGKRLAERVSEIVVTFRRVPHSIFDGSAGPIAPNRLVLRLQPDEGVRLGVMLKEPGPGGLRLRHVPLDMSFAKAFGGDQPDAYERLLMDVIRGNPTLFMRRDEVEAAWRWIDPILSAWQSGHAAPKSYTAGCWGPSAAFALIERDGRTWHEDAA